MQKPFVNIKSLISDEERKVAGLVAELEATQNVTPSAIWTELLSASTKGGKCPMS